MNEDNKMHRRQVIGRLGATLAAVAVTPVFASPGKKIHRETPEGLVNPVTKYPKPPFPGQTQPWPGLVSKMNPRPDHGETSYKGSGRAVAMQTDRSTVLPEVRVSHKSGAEFIGICFSGAEKNKIKMNN